MSETKAFRQAITFSQKDKRAALGKVFFFFKKKKAQGEGGPSFTSLVKKSFVANVALI